MAAKTTTLLLLTALALPAAAQEQRLTLIAMGDVTLGNHFREFDAKLRAGGADEDTIARYPFLRVKPLLEEADLVLANYEGTFTTTTQKTPKNFNFRADPREVAKLQAAGIDVVSLANNHSFDFGTQGLADTMRTLDNAGIEHFGAGMNLREARRYLLYRVRELGVCFLGYHYLGNYRVEPSVLWAGEDKPGMAGVPPALDSLAPMQAMVAEDLDRMAADAECHMRVVYFHWGREGRATPKRYQRELAQVAADHGADFVLGSHPHVLQGVDTLTARDGSRVPVAYSLGNFVFAGKWNPKNKNSLLVKASLALDGDKRRRTLELIPVHTDNFPATPFQPYAQDETQGRHLLRDLDCRSEAGKPAYCGTDKVDDADPAYPEPFAP
jgi:poly-gamma-glutamate synthesis protein (capsule biosynthesis protein)